MRKLLCAIYDALESIVNTLTPETTEQTTERLTKKTKGGNKK